MTIQRSTPAGVIVPHWVAARLKDRPTALAAYVLLLGPDETDVEVDDGDLPALAEVGAFVQDDDGISSYLPRPAPIPLEAPVSPRPTRRVDALSRAADHIPGRGHHVVYRLRKDGELLYIGVTSNLRSRLRPHRLRWPGCDATWDEYETRHDAEVGEADAIRSESPRYNLAGVDG